MKSDGDELADMMDRVCWVVMQLTALLSVLMCLVAALLTYL